MRVLIGALIVTLAACGCGPGDKDNDPPADESPAVENTVAADSLKLLQTNPKLDEARAVFSLSSADRKKLFTAIAAVNAIHQRGDEGLSRQEHQTLLRALDRAVQPAFAAPQLRQTPTILSAIRAAVMWEHYAAEAWASPHPNAESVRDVCWGCGQLRAASLMYIPKSESADALAWSIALLEVDQYQFRESLALYQEVVGRSPRRQNR